LAIRGAKNRRVAQQPDHQPVTDVEIPFAAAAGQHGAEADHHRAEQRRDHRADAIGDPAEGDAADPGADIGERVV